MWRGKNSNFEDEIEENTGGCIYCFMCGILWLILFNILWHNIAISLSSVLGNRQFGVGGRFHDINWFMNVSLFCKVCLNFVPLLACLAFKAFLTVAETCFLVAPFASRLHFCFNLMCSTEGQWYLCKGICLTSVSQHFRYLEKIYWKLASIYCFKKDLCLQQTAFKKLMMQVLFAIQGMNWRKINRLY